ncbi:hypothetical protein PIB30_057117 [Stylosanthes scabra]|uniref:Disease resistance RPP13-like protein 1 n=1 Tax=Stylosanthes scabra TaxID=79078 RepID=A0ABU6QJE7_9FABA|nr:hypothetical protein [Stylosanthes scabra]
MASKFEGRAYLSSFVDAVLNKLSSLDDNSTPMGWKLADQSLLQSLEKSLLHVRPVLDDAEQKQIKDQEVKKWHVDLQDALYMADDLLDELSTRAATATPTPGNHSSWCDSVVDSMVQGNDDSEKMRAVVVKLEFIVEKKNVLRLKQEPVKDLTDMSWRNQSSLVESSDIFGRDNDKEAIIELLLDDTRDANISVIPIVGMGGAGKTTLAQLVYSDARVEEKFDNKAWVCVSDDFDVLKVTKTLIKAIGGSSCNEDDLNLLQTELKDKLMGKKFLIVLDDVWIDISKHWKTLQKPFQYGKKGSKVLVTTRDNNVVDVVKPISTYTLALLSEKDCWSLFVKHALLSPESMEYSTLEPVGRELIKKCKGLPLAVESLGALFRATNYNERDWDNVLKSELWEVFEDQKNDEMIPALRISYYYLPSNLKRCFVYCSLFPKDYEFDKDELVLLWMAEELLQPKGKKTPEEIGCEYFDELVARSFFQFSRTHDGLYVIHDIMHDLATICAGEFHFRAEKVEENNRISNKTRHLLHNSRGNYPFSQLVAACDRVKDVRTLLEINLGPMDPFNMKSAPHMFSSQLKCLRVLSFNSFPLYSLPDSIGELIHLRYLNLSYTHISTLPKELCNLYNLQTLKLKDCKFLKKLPNNMQDLVNLRHLDIEGTGLEEMPKGISKLKNLQFLSDYIVGRHEKNNGIEELGALANIHKRLQISQLENIINGDQAWKARIAEKKNIRGLSLTWSWNNHTVDSQDIINNLRPHTNLRKLSIHEYKGQKFPNWLGHSSYRNMTEMYLSGCNNCFELPSLGQLPSLKHLQLSNFCKLARIGAEFYRDGDESSSCGVPFPMLETLSFHAMGCWEEWLTVSSELDAFPRLRVLTLRYCPALRGDLPSQLPTLERLCIGLCDKLAFTLPREHAVLELSVEGPQVVKAMFEAIACNQLNSLQSLSISGCSSSILFPEICLPSSLQNLEIVNCPHLEFPMLPPHHESLQLVSIDDSCYSLASFPFASFPNLTELKISSCENMRTLAASDHTTASTSTSSLRSLRIMNCPRLESFQMVAPHLEDLSVGYCPELELFFEGGLPPNLRELRIRYCKKLVRYLASMDLSDHCLTHLDIWHPYDNINSFPIDGCLPPSLETLCLRCFPSLEILDCKGLDYLQQLAIDHCPNLHDVVGKSFPTSLSILYFDGDSLLKERVQMMDPHILSKMSHVRNIHIE